MQAMEQAGRVAHDKDWFLQDGDIVLSASQQSQTRLFKVHRAILAHHSALFADMFTLPCSANIDDTYDGTPVVHMQDDPDDLAQFIGALYDSDLPLMRPLDPHNPDRARGAMKLARKYDADSVCTRIIRRLEADWPQDVFDWLRLCADLKTRSELRKILVQRAGSATDTPTNVLIPEPVSAIRFAREFHVPSILPAAFYTLVLTDIHHDPDSLGIADTFRVARWSLLGQEDMLRLLRGKVSLRNAITHMMNVPFPGESYCATCTNSRLPRVFSERWSNHLTAQGFFGGISLAETPDIFGILFTFLELLDDNCREFDGMCARHRSLYSKFFTLKIELEWTRLPDVFQLWEAAKTTI